jgi:hypothetical protein
MKTGAGRLRGSEPPLDAASDMGGVTDAAWFRANPRRQFRGRLSGDHLWVIRALPGSGEFLRVRTAAAAMPRRDADPGLAFLFFSAIWRDLDNAEIRKLARRALNGGSR